MRLKTFAYFSRNFSFAGIPSSDQYRIKFDISFLNPLYFFAKTFFLISLYFCGLNLWYFNRVVKILGFNIWVCGKTSVLYSTLIVPFLLTDHYNWSVRGGRPTTSISSSNHILLIFSSEPHRNHRPFNIIFF